MNLENIIWNEETYQDFLQYLFQIKDEQYASFHQNLVKNKEVKIIGIRTPILKELAKKIAKTDYLSFFKENKHQYYEEIILHGLVITYLKDDFQYTLSLFDEYISYINNWASCDIIVCNYKLFKKHLEEGFVKVNEYVHSSDSFKIRVGLVLLLTYYINENYIDKVLTIANHIHDEDYYVKMANAWLISVCLVKFYDKTILFLKNNKLDDWTHNKAIQKAIESYRIKDKEELRKLKRK